MTLECYSSVSDSCPWRTGALILSPALGSQELNFAFLFLVHCLHYFPAFHCSLLPLSFHLPCPRTCIFQQTSSTKTTNRRRNKTVRWLKGHTPQTEKSHLFGNLPSSCWGTKEKSVPLTYMSRMELVPVLSGVVFIH